MRKIDKKEIVYTWTEVNVPQGYTLSGSTTEATLTTLTNTHTPSEVSVHVEKIWDDQNNKDQIRPASITVQLKADGADKGDPIVLDARNQWKYTWEKLPEKKDGGQAIVYTVDEVAIPFDYTKTVTGDMTTGFIITNSRAGRRRVPPGRSSAPLRWRSGFLRSLCYSFLLP